MLERLSGSDMNKLTVANMQVEALRKQIADAQATIADLQGQVEVNVDALVDRFLAWPLPASVCSDLCATKQGYPHRSGTNLLSAVEAKAMLEYVLGIAQQAQEGGVGDANIKMS